MAFIQNACKFYKRTVNNEFYSHMGCGQTKELTYVFNLPKLIIKKTNRDLGFKSVYGRKLSKEQLADLKATF
jgi:uncharacterized circularly permuted ATP-grasp superfamily protein